MEQSLLGALQALLGGDPLPVASLLPGLSLPLLLPEIQGISTFSLLMNLERILNLRKLLMVEFQAFPQSALNGWTASDSL